MNKDIFDLGIPVMAIGYGTRFIELAFGGSSTKSLHNRYDFDSVMRIEKASYLMEWRTPKYDGWMWTAYLRPPLKGLKRLQN